MVYLWHSITVEASWGVGRKNKDSKPFASHPEALTAIKFIAWQELSGDEDSNKDGLLS